MATLSSKVTPSGVATAAQGTLADAAVQPNDSPTFGNVTATAFAGDGSSLTGVLRKGTDIGYVADLNTYTTDGYYHQNSNANAISGTNYPATVAGMLTVTADGNMVYQKYQTYNGLGVYQRTKYSTTWYAWDKVLDSGNLTTTGTLTATSFAGDGSGLTGIESVPASTVIYVAQSTAPTGYVKANGAALSRTTYAALFAAIGTTFGVGDGSTTFNLPDLRGEFLRGWDDGRGVDSGRVFGSAQTDEFKSHNHVSGVTTNNSGTEAYGALTSGINTPDSYSQNTVNGNRSAYTSTVGGTETRPRNIALLACIKY